MRSVAVVFGKCVGILSTHRSGLRLDIADVDCIVTCVGLDRIGGHRVGGDRNELLSRVLDPSST